MTAMVFPTRVAFSIFRHDDKLFMAALFSDGTIEISRAEGVWQGFVGFAHVLATGDVL